jgi:hypothetical protein
MPRIIGHAGARTTILSKALKIYHERYQELIGRRSEPAHPVIKVACWRSRSCREAHIGNRQLPIPHDEKHCFGMQIELRRASLAGPSDRSGAKHVLLDYIGNDSKELDLLAGFARPLDLLKAACIWTRLREIESKSKTSVSPRQIRTSLLKRSENIRQHLRLDPDPLIREIDSDTCPV